MRKESEERLKKTEGNKEINKDPKTRRKRTRDTGRGTTRTNIGRKKEK